MEIAERKEALAKVLSGRGIVDELCECGCLRSEHDDVGPAIGHASCLVCECEKFRWVPGGVEAAGGA